MYTLKSIVRRGTALGAAVAVFAAAIVPAAPAFADALNPLTERSLLLTSSAPGFQNSDGSGNSEGALNADNDQYAPPGSGPNGQKTGQTFSFNVSTDSSVGGKTLKGFSLQYCTLAAGLCKSPGNNDGDTRTLPSSDRLTNAAAFTAGQGQSDFDVVGSWTDAGTGTIGAGQFQVIVNGAPSGAGWTMATKNVEDNLFNGGTPSTGLNGLTGKNNFITLTSATGVTPTTGQNVKIIFKPSSTSYITNPGAKEFFVKINSYDTEDTDEFVDQVAPATNTHLLDGGVTVANVMTDSIHITTKVLETMSFSVGTRNRDTVTLTNPDTHGPCDPIQVVNGNRLNLGDPNAEYSLKTDTAYDVYSYWRLSSNSSGGATVYYSGNTLANTVGDEIAPIGPSATTSLPGAEQFGLGFVDATTDDETPTDKFDPAFKTLVTNNPTRFKMPTLDVLDPVAAYAGGEGTINGGSPTATFAFEKESNTVPRLIAEDSDNVISCDTAKMRYVANIGADTPAGVYTTKINYLAAPQY
jgi:hypothetical protein